MTHRLALGALILAATLGAARAEPLMPFAAHRAAYELSLSKTSTAQGQQSQAPVAASGLIAYEFRGSACEGYAANFRQVTQLQRGEGGPVTSDTQAITFEDGQAKTLRFQVDSTMSENPSPPVEGVATRSEAGEISVDLTRPNKETVRLGKDLLFPTQHLGRIIGAAKSGLGTLDARVFDGSETGKKTYDTLTVIGKEATAPALDATTAAALKSVRRWPVTISYFDSARKDAPPEYVLSFDLYENGVSGSLKLDYGSFALDAQLTRLELLPASVCK